MTPDQLTGLETLVGRALTTEEAAVIAPLVDAWDYAGVASALPARLPQYVPTEIGKGTIIERLGLISANGVIDAILSTADYRHIKELLEQGRLRLDIAAQGGLLQPLVPGVMTQAQLDALCAAALRPRPYLQSELIDAIGVERRAG